MLSDEGSTPSLDSDQRAHVHEQTRLVQTSTSVLSSLPAQEGFPSPVYLTQPWSSSNALQ